jgi:hypothetical protein
VCVGAELPDGDAFLAQLASVANVPTFQAGFGDFGVKLEREGKVSDGECLIFVEIRPGEV